MAGRDSSAVVGATGPERPPHRRTGSVATGHRDLGGLFRWHPVARHHYRSSEQRFALDIVALRRSGARARGLLPRNVNAYACYGAVVRSPARGTVARVADGEPDQVPGEVRPCLPTGNYVVVDTGAELVYLCHLQQGSIRVSPGDQVGPGDELGLVGNSGRSTEPHLHIHAQSKDEPQGRLLDFEGVASQPVTRDMVVVRP